MSYKVIKKLTYTELLEKFTALNTGVKVVKWQPLIGDDSKAYANPNQPTIRVDLEDGGWLRVYVDKENNEINWF